REVATRLARGDETRGPDDIAAADHRALAEQRVGELAIEGEGAIAVVDDHHDAEAGKRRRKRDRPLVNRRHRRAFRPRDLNTVSDDRGAEPAFGRAAEAAQHGAIQRPVEITTEGA